MSCSNMTVRLTAEQTTKRATALTRLETMLAAGTATVVIGATGAIAFKGWQSSDVGMVDACVYRRLLASNSPGLRRAIARAEAVSGRKVNPQAIASGTHSHDGGKTWGSH